MNASENSPHNKDGVEHASHSQRPLFYAQAGLISLHASPRAQRRQEGTWVDEPGWRPARRPAMPDAGIPTKIPTKDGGHAAEPSVPGATSALPAHADSSRGSGEEKGASSEMSGMPLSAQLVAGLSGFLSRRQQSHAHVNGVSDADPKPTQDRMRSGDVPEAQGGDSLQVKIASRIEPHRPLSEPALGSAGWVPAHPKRKF